MKNKPFKVDDYLITKKVKRPIGKYKLGGKNEKSKKTTQNR